MARINNLTNFLTDVASAIKTKLGDNTSIPASQFDTKIDSIKGIGDGYTDNITSGYTGYAQAPYTTTTYRRILSIWLLKEIPNKAITLPDAIGTRLSYGFYLCTNLEKADLSNWINLSYISQFKGLFYGCTALKEVNIKGSNLADASNLSLMFKECPSLKRVDISGITSSGADIGEMFMACTNLEYIDISGIDLSACTNTNTMWGSAQYGYVPKNCEIIVKNSTEKTFVENFGYTNVKIKS